MIQDPDCSKWMRNNDCKNSRIKHDFNSHSGTFWGMPQTNGAIIGHSTSQKAREKAKAKESRCDGARALACPHPMPGQALGKICDNSSSFQMAMDKNQQCSPSCPFQGPRDRIDQWRRLGADNVLIMGIQKGVAAPMHKVPNPQPARAINGEELLTTTISEYLATGAIRPLQLEEFKRTKSWIPIFPRQKKDSNKIRVMTCLRNLNMCHHVPKHKTESWRSVIEMLKNPNAKWGMTLDLKNWFHHLAMRPDVARWMRFQHQGKPFQVQAMPFGWAMSPWWSQKLSKPIRAHMNQCGWIHCWFVDDILLLGSTPEEVTQMAIEFVDLLKSLGIQVNKEKSMSQPSREIKYLGHMIQLESNKIAPIPEKNNKTIQMIRHQISGNTTTPRWIHALAGHLLDSQKSNERLRGLPQQLMRCTAQALNMIVRRQPWWPKQKCWAKSVPKPKDLDRILRSCLEAVQMSAPRTFRPSNDKKFTILTDASLSGWGASLQRAGREIQATAQLWTQAEKRFHITQLEATASARAVECFLPLVPRGSTLQVKSDAISTIWAWRKGSKRPTINNAIAKAAQLANNKNVYIEAEFVPGNMNHRADYLSRNPDCQNYHLDPRCFQMACQRFNFQPTIDLFANRQNRQTSRFCSWRLDPKSAVNAFNIDWSQERGWLNPPWAIIGQCIKKIKSDKATVLACLPMWKTAPWWRDVQEMSQPHPFLVIKNRPIFQNPKGENLPCP